MQIWQLARLDLKLATQVAELLLLVLLQSKDYLRQGHHGGSNSDTPEMLQGKYSSVYELYLTFWLFDLPLNQMFDQKC